MDESTPKVGIVLPTHNREKFLRQSIDSCLNQTYKNIELIVVNDASTDNTEEIIKECADPRVKYLKNESKLGIAKSLNRGFSNSTGEYLTWTSDDNTYLNTAVEEMVNELKRNKEIDFVYASRYEMDENGKIVGKRKAGPPKNLDTDNCVGSCFLYRRRVYEKVGDYDPSFFLAEDYEYWMRVRNQFKIKRLDKYLYLSRYHKGTLRNKYPEEVVKAGRMVRDRYISDASKKDYFMAEDYFRRQDKKNCILYLKRSLSRTPFNMRAIRLFVLVIMPEPLIKMLRNIKQGLFS